MGQSLITILFHSIITVKMSTFTKHSPLSFARLSPELSSTYMCQKLPSVKLIFSHTSFVSIEYKISSED